MDLPTVKAYSHKINARIFEHNYGEYKTKICRQADAQHIFSTQLSSEFAENTCAISYENRFLVILTKKLLVYSCIILIELLRKIWYNFYYFNYVKYIFPLILHKTNKEF